MGGTVSITDLDRAMYPKRDDTAIEQLKAEAARRRKVAEQNAKSAQVCGCDAGAGHRCEACTKALDRAAALLVSKITDRPGVFPESAAGRKTYPVFTGVLMYFPDAIAAVANVSYKGNEQHNPGQALHWAREKSTDQTDTATRHMMDHGVGHTKDTDGAYHLAKAAWRILAELQLTIEKEREGR